MPAGGESAGGPVASSAVPSVRKIPLDRVAAFA
jgi:hypothetical protein